MGHQDLTLLYVWGELILYCSPNCVYSTMQTQSNSNVLGVSSKPVSQQSEKMSSPKSDDLFKKKDQRNFDDVTRHIGQVTIGSKNRALFASPGIL